MNNSSSVRAMVVWCPDWPVTAACRATDTDVHTPVAVLRLNRVVHCTPAARAAGVRPGQRKRDAQALCPDMVLFEQDPARDAIAFEPVVAALEELAAGVEVLRPGSCALAARGPAGWYGGEERAGETIVDKLALACDVEAQVGIADGVHAAALAALTGAIVPPGDSARFLTGLDVGLLGRPELVGLLRRLGITTLGAFADLPAGDVGARFGADGALAHALASGRDERLLAPRTPPLGLEVGQVFDEPLERVDAAAFAARALAEELQDLLTGYGLACTRLVIEATTTSGADLRRVWRHDALLRAADVSDRLRWQLDGWLTHTARRGGEPSGIARLRLVPEGIVTAGALQPGLWGGAGDDRERADRAAARLQGMLGPEAVMAPVLDGGRDPGERVRLVPWGDERGPVRPTDRPWPGALPAPYPSTVYPSPPAVGLFDDAGRPVTVTGRAELSGPPARIVFEGGAAAGVLAWAGPLPADDRWWDAAAARRQARLQLLLAADRAVLVSCSAGTWRLEADYD
ncbi:DNA polymerase Y family protein [Longispora sp. NPDC051575]|uniref:DNA polymerase Y family protein n=1 Tax=Longispora sp. NPDC051575 TaxID=3154943 RepID=UPI003411FC29